MARRRVTGLTRLVRSLISLRLALTGVAQWVGHWPANLKFASLTPSQGTCWLGCWLGPWSEACKRQPMDVSFTLGCFFPYLSPACPPSQAESMGLSLCTVCRIQSASYSLPSCHHLLCFLEILAYAGISKRKTSTLHFRVGGVYC